MRRKSVAWIIQLSFELIFAAFFLFQGLSYVGKTITGDGIGYYDYLPSIFIHHDFVRKDNSEKENIAFHDRTKKTGLYTHVDGKWVNRYACGTAVLESPFFFASWIFTKMDGSYNDGYQDSFHRSIYFAAVFYLFLSLVFLRKLLKLYQIQPITIRLSQILLVLATSVIQYATYNAAFSHVYSLFAITAFLFFCKKFFEMHDKKSFILAAIFLGLVIILRQINGFILFFVPFLAGSWEKLNNGVRYLFGEISLLVFGMAVCFLVISIQLLAWYFQTGSFIVYSYEGYGFNWFQPEMLNILFSYKKGLFVYTPITFIGLFGLIYFIKQKRYFEFFSWFSFFLLITYLLSSWCYWYYGRSYGLRAYIEFYPIFFIPLAYLLNTSKKSLRIIFVCISLLTIPLNIIQTNQYQRYILHGTDMNKERYWKVFLKTDERYKGIFYNRNFDENKFELVNAIKLGNFSLKENSNQTIWESEGNALFEKKVSIIEVSLDGKFEKDDWSRLLISVDEDKTNKLFHRPYLLKFANSKLGQMQTGSYNYEVQNIDIWQNSNVRFILFSKDSPLEVENVILKLYSKKD